MTTSPKAVFRMRARGPTIALLISLVFVASCMESKDTGVDTAIREAARQKCEDQAVQWLRWATKEHGQDYVFPRIENTINSHYSERMDTCLVHHKLGTSENTVLEEIINIKENKAIAGWFAFDTSAKPSVCWVGEQECKSVEEWKTLARPYMEE